jgi:hypothetical protein
MKKKRTEESPKRLERVKDKLYNPSWKGEGVRMRPAFYSREAEVSRGWGKRETSSTEEKPKKNTAVRVFFLVSVVFFVAAVGIAAYLLTSGGNSVSSDQIAIVFDGPVSVGGGDELLVTMSITNNNALALEGANVVITYPAGFHAVDDVTGEKLIREYRSLGTIAPGDTKKEIIRGVVFGSEDSEKAVKIAMEYGVSNSNATFIKETTYATRIDSAPITVSIDTLREVNAGQEIDVAIRIKSNTKETIEDVVLIVEYPFGFDPMYSNPLPTQGSTVWHVGDISPGEEESLVIRGIVRGQNNDERTFRTMVGTAHPEDESALAVTYNEESLTVLVQDTFLAVQLALNGSVADTYMITPDAMVRGTVSYVNNLSVPLQDVVIELALTGSPIIDKFSVDSPKAYYDSSAGVLRWSKSTKSLLDELEPGESGEFTFSFDLLPFITGEGVRAKNPLITYTLSVQGVRAGSGNVAESHDATIVRTMKVSTDMRITGQSAYTVGPFTNTGSVPPQVEEETTYTIVLSAVNASNDIRNATVTAQLPEGVLWKEAISPSGADITYNATQRTVTWTIGSVNAGTGIESAGPSVAFQIGLVPSITQISSSPVLLSDIVMTAYDAFTGETIRATSVDLTTELKGDPAYQPDWARVGN